MEIKTEVKLEYYICHKDGGVYGRREMNLSIEDILDGGVRDKLDKPPTLGMDKYDDYRHCDFRLILVNK